VRVKMDESLVTYFADKLAAERKSLAQLERIWKESIVIPFTNLHAGKRQGGAKISVTIEVAGREVKVSTEEPRTPAVE
jgi:hypothetical protein